MFPKVQNYILASGDSVAIDSIAAKMMGFDPMEIPYIRMCDEMGLGVGNPKNIEIAGEDISKVNFGFKTSRVSSSGRSAAPPRPPAVPRKTLLHSPLVVWRRSPPIYTTITCGTPL